MRRISTAAAATGLALLGPVGAANSAEADAPAAAVKVPSQLWNGTQGVDYCATPEGDSRANGAIITVWRCTGGASQKWYFDEFGRLVNNASGKCLTPAGHDVKTNGMNLTLWTCGHNAQYRVVPAGIRLSGTDKRRTPKGNNMANGGIPMVVDSRPRSGPGESNYGWLPMSRGRPVQAHRRVVAPAGR
ncbi:RICIN domain-containing protein [Streptomyces sp. NPDC058619]|uniref:RICIN domain-containing protein n=1 Tax=unclassified Streptomyces TaxID=2593676 RepID=UPI0036604905